MDQYTNLLIYLSGPAIIGLVVWTWKLWQSFQEFKVYVANQYIKAEALKDLQNDIKALSIVVWEIAGKLGVPIRRDN